MTENLLSVCLRGVLKVWCGRPREQGGEGRGGLEALSGQNGLCSTGRPRTGWVDADDAGSRVRHQDLGPESIFLPLLPLSVPQLLPEGPSSSPTLGLGK